MIDGLPPHIKPYYYDEDADIVIYHADCREILPHLPKVDLVLTDPPYGVGAKYKNSYDDNRSEYWTWFLPVLDLILNKSKVVALHHQVKALQFIQGWDDVVVWFKPYKRTSRLGNSPILPCWEPVLLFGIHTIGVHTKYMKNVLIHNPDGSGVAGKSIGRERLAIDPGEQHPFPKPIALEIALIEGLSNNNAIFLDPFLGSGTTLVACKQLHRKGIGIEIEEKYCEIARKRLLQGVLPL